MNLHQILHEAGTFLHGNYSDGSEGWRYEQRVIGSFIMTICLLIHHVSCRVLARYQITQVAQPPYRWDLVPWNFWLFPELKSPLKGKRFQTVDEIQENTTGQLMVTGRTVWGPEVPTWRRLSCLCPMYSVSCIFFNKCLYFSYYVAGYLLDRPRKATNLWSHSNSINNPCIVKGKRDHLSKSGFWLVFSMTIGHRGQCGQVRHCRQIHTQVNLLHTRALMTHAHRLVNCYDAGWCAVKNEKVKKKGRKTATLLPSLEKYNLLINVEPGVAFL